MTVKGLQWPLACALAALVVFGAGYAAGTLNGRQGAALSAAEDEIDTRGRIDDALANPDGCAWLDRLRGTCVD